jgi:dephospho-CoA kinase
MKLPQIIGISGTNGAGKDELGLLLAERCGYHFHTVSDLLRHELARQGKPQTRANMASLSKKWRNESGDDGIMFTKAIAEYFVEKEEKGYKGLVLVNARHPEEAKVVQKNHGAVIWVDADQRIRYNRIQAGNRGRHEDDSTFEEFQADEYREMHPPADAPRGTLHMDAVKKLADIRIENDFPTVEEYRAYLIKEFGL